MDLKFDDLKYLVKVVADDLLKDDFDNFLDSLSNSASVVCPLSVVSEEMYDKVSVLRD